MLADNQLKELLRLARAGDKAARDEILNNNLNLVRSVIQRFCNRGYEWDDLFQIGCIGLIKSVERFDPSFDVKFSTYAVPMIIGEIRRFMRDDNPVKVCRPVKEMAFRAIKAQERLQGQLGRDPTISEVARELSVSPEEVVAALEAMQPIASLHDPVFQDGGEPIHRLDQIAGGEDHGETDIDKLALREVLQRLPSRERQVVVLRFFEDKTQAEIASVIGLSQVQVSRIEKHALKRIREYLQTS